MSLALHRCRLCIRLWSLALCPSSATCTVAATAAAAMVVTPPAQLHDKAIAAQVLYKLLRDADRRGDLHPGRAIQVATVYTQRALPVEELQPQEALARAPWPLAARQARELSNVDTQDTLWGAAQAGALDAEGCIVAVVAARCECPP